LTGFAHGMSGIAAALLEFYHITQNEDSLNLALSAMNYENSCFNTDVNNWPDFRQFDTSRKQKNNCSMAWCHGAPGIGLQRLRAWEITGDEKWLNDATKAAYSTLKSSMEFFQTQRGNFSLNHGIFGNNELLLEYDIKTNSNLFKQYVYQMAKNAIENIEMKGRTWPCGLHNSDESTGFMLGIAGVAYHFMRLYKYDQVENILI
jgi:lantibiotic modifying enzyme